MEDSAHMDSKKALVVDHPGPTSTDASTGGKNIGKKSSSGYSSSIGLGFCSEDRFPPVAITGVSCTLNFVVVEPMLVLGMLDITFASVGGVHGRPKA
jgi:hypothetical protein